MNKNLKFLFITLLLLCFYIFSINGETNILSKKNDKILIKILGEVEKESYAAVIYYDDEKIDNNLTILNEDNKRFNISQTGRTKEFRIIIEGNQEEAKKIEIKIQGNKFVGAKGTITENIDTQFYVNAIIPNLSDFEIPEDNQPFLVSLNIPKGTHNLENNIIETKFVLAWKGNSTLPAGMYSSDINIEYNVIE